MLDVFARGRAGLAAEFKEASNLERAFNAVDAAKVAEADDALVPREERCKRARASAGCGAGADHRAYRKQVRRVRYGCGRSTRDDF